MISRRGLLTGSAALAAFSTLQSRNAQATLTGAIPGVIRWDPWYSQLAGPRLYQNSLGPAAWQFRAPWFTTVDSPYHVTANGTQANVDLEIKLAAQAGYKYFAFVWYKAGVTNGPALNPGFDVSFDLYSASAFKASVKWCAIGSIAMWGASTPFANNDWQAQVNQWVTYFKQSNYQTVLGNRPLVYILWSAADITNWFSGSIANAATAIAYLRSQCSAAGVGNPYVVIQNGTGATAAATISSVGADACGLYTSAFAGTQTPDPYTTLDTQSQATWVAQAASGYPIIPIVQHGWDTRPRKQNPIPGQGFRPYLGQNVYFQTGTPAQIAGQYTEALAYMEANPSIVPSKALLAYSWTECDEGGSSAIPTLGDPPTQTDPGQPLPTSNLLAAIGPILRAAA